MKYPVLNFSEVKEKEFVDFWSNLYYIYNNRVKEADYENLIDNDSFDIEQIKKLFNWKNGMPITGKEKTHKNKAKFLSDVQSVLGEINALKKKFDEQKIGEVLKKKSGIWAIFLLHIINPNKYPIFDQHVYRAYKF